MSDIYKRLVIIDELAEKINNEIAAMGDTGNVINQYEIRFYEDDRGRQVGIKFFFNEDAKPITQLSILENIKNATGADDIFFDVDEGQYITAVELFFEEADAQ
ncbi:MAG: hypothetical protein J7J42_01780 [Thermoplasmata archaeon]|nr:hypothetical protein [Thermoplasmata archaeon]